MSIIKFVKLLPKAFKEWLRDRGDGLSASIAYYQFMSIAPFVALLYIGISILSGDKKEAESLIGQFIHPQFITAIKFMLSYSYKLEGGKFFAISALALISLVHGIVGYFTQLKDSVETFWNLRTEEVGIKRRLIKQLEALYMGFVVFVLLMAGFILRYLFLAFPFIPFFFIELLIESIVIFGIILFFFTYCPPLKINWWDAVPGTILTTVLYMIGRGILNYLLNKSEDSSENVAAAMIMYLLWSYYSSITLLYGAEFSKLYIGKKRGIDVNKLTYS